MRIHSRFFLNFKSRCILLTAIVFLLSPVKKLCAQTTYVPQNSPTYDILDRMEIKSGNLRDGLFLDISPVRRDLVGTYINSIDTTVKFTKADKYWIKYMKSDNQPYSDSTERYDAKHPVLGFYKSQANLFQVDTKLFHLYLNPVFDFEYGKEKGAKDYLSNNSKYFEVRGDIDNKIGFYTYFTDNQTFYPSYVKNFITSYGAVPGQGFWKTYKRGNDSSGADYISARGYVTYSPTEHIHMQFGNDRNFIGSGYRSLILSDFAKEYLFLKINTQIWRFNYQNLFMQMTDYTPTGVKPYPRKYAAIHTLSYDAARWWNISLTEDIIFHDNLGNGRGYELEYLNPIIFYRSAESSLGSPDNELIAMNNDFLICRHLKIYQQTLFDELKVHELVDGKNWWGNKYALQFGFKYIDVLGLPNVDWQAEFNYIRPFTYTSDTSGKNFTQFRQSLGSPIGPNSEELINILRINIFGPLDIRLKYFYIRQGHALNGQDLGSDILIPYTWAAADHTYGNTMLQGDLVTTTIAEAQISYMIRHNLFLDLTYMDRLEKDAKVVYNKTNYINVGLRMNFIKQNNEF